MIDFRVVGEMPPIAMLEVGNVMSASQVSWTFQRMHMIHDCFHQIFRALGMFHAKRRHVNRIVPAGKAATTHSASVSVIILKGTRTSTKVFGGTGTVIGSLACSMCTSWVMLMCISSSMACGYCNICSGVGIQHCGPGDNPTLSQKM